MYINTLTQPGNKFLDLQDFKIKIPQSEREGPAGRVNSDMLSPLAVGCLEVPEKTSYGSTSDIARPPDRPHVEASVRAKRSISVAAGARAPRHHLAAYATSAARLQKKSVDQRRLTPQEYKIRKRGGELKDVKAVVCLMAHDGVVRPDAWRRFLQDPRVSFLGDPL